MTQNRSERRLHRAMRQKKRRCERCGRWFHPMTYKSRFCTHDCLQTAWKARRRQRLKKRRCEWCGHWYQPRMRHCRTCSQRCCCRLSLHNKRQRLKQLAVAYKGGRCKKCGYRECLAALEFHHRRPGCKDLTVKIVGAWAWSARLRRELDKCDLLCSNCHRETHYRRVSL